MLLRTNDNPIPGFYAVRPSSLGVSNRHNGVLSISMTWIWAVGHFEMPIRKQNHNSKNNNSKITVSVWIYANKILLE